MMLGRALSLLRESQLVFQGRDTWLLLSKCFHLPNTHEASGLALNSDRDYFI